MPRTISTLVLAFVFGLSSVAGAKDRLPDGGVAEASGHGPVRAWYERPTTRYDHGVLGDAIEGGSLVVQDDAGRRHELVLPESFVFEDITPRIADLDGDGENEVITIRTDVKSGSAVAVYGIENGKLVERASTMPLGTPHRWLSIAGIGDFLGDGRREIAIVKTPHIGGVLEVLALRSDRLVSLHQPRSGYSSHFIGARFVSLAAVDDTHGDGIARLIVADQERTHIVVLDLRTGVDPVSSYPLPARLVRPLRLLGHGRIEATLETGKTMILDLAKGRPVEP